MPEGFDIIVNGTPRTFRDTEAAAYDAAQVLKKRWPHDEVQIRRPDGTVVTMKPDGRAD